MQQWPMNTMAKTFLCPGLVIRVPKASEEGLYRIDYCWTGSCDVTDLKTNRTSMLLTDYIRVHAVLVGKNYRQKI